MKSKFELADVIRRFGKKLLENHSITPLQIKVLRKIEHCRTAVLGGHEEQCDCCQAKRYSYNSCGDRHCPKCLSAKQAIWIERLLQKTLPVKHFHIIFTVPHCLNKVCLFNDRMYYKLLFDAVWQTLRSFGYTHYGVESGAVAVLHSWGQNLSLHPHIHCIVPAAGYSIKGEWKNIGNSGKFLYPIWQLSETFKGKFLDSLTRKLKKSDDYSKFEVLLEKANQTKWVVNCQPAMAKAENVIRYLGQYTHRVAITNHRILNITKTHVTFIAKDYTDNAKKKRVTLKGEEFLRRFCMHILPKRFVKIRRYGIYNHTTIRNLDLQFIRKESKVEIALKEIPEKETAQESLKRLTGIDVYKCPFCKKGKMQVIKKLKPKIRSPDDFLFDQSPKK